MKPRSFLLLCVAVLFIAHNVNANEIRSHKPTTINFSSELPSSGNLVLGIYENNLLGSYGKSIEKKSKGGLSHALKATDFEAKIMSSQLITAPMNSGFDQILLVGLGEKDQSKTDVEWQNIGGNAIQKAVNLFKIAPVITLDTSADVAANFAYGAKLGSYYFDKYYTDEERHKHQQQITFVTPQSKKANAIYSQQLNPVANAIWHTRNMSNEPANVIYPESFVQQWSQHLKGLDNIKIRVYDEKDMLKKNMGAIYGVGQGSKRPPRMMIVEYMGGNKGEAPVVIVGKGITFDTGGISIKGSKNMWTRDGGSGR